MALTSCPDCGGMVSDSAPVCPHCGRPLLAPPQPETLMLDVMANMVRGIEAQGGMLTITSLRVRFQPHQLNISIAPFEILRSDIWQVETYNSLGIVPNGVLIRTRSGAEFKFVVSSRADVVRCLQTAP